MKTWEHRKIMKTWEPGKVLKTLEPGKVMKTWNLEVMKTWESRSHENVGIWKKKVKKIWEFGENHENLERMWSLVLITGFQN